MLSQREPGENGHQAHLCDPRPTHLLDLPSLVTHGQRVDATYHHDITVTTGTYHTVTKCQTLLSTFCYSHSVSPPEDWQGVVMTTVCIFYGGKLLRKAVMWQAPVVFRARRLFHFLDGQQPFCSGELLLSTPRGVLTGLLLIAPCQCHHAMVDT